MTIEIENNHWIKCNNSTIRPNEGELYRVKDYDGSLYALFYRNGLWCTLNKEKPFPFTPEYWQKINWDKI